MDTATFSEKKIVEAPWYSSFYAYWVDQWMISQINAVWYPETHTDVVELTEENFNKEIY